MIVYKMLQKGEHNQDNGGLKKRASVAFAVVTHAHAVVNVEGRPALAPVVFAIKFFLLATSPHIELIVILINCKNKHVLAVDS